jgi:hypothetical protein
MVSNVDGPNCRPSEKYLKTLPGPYSGIQELPVSSEALKKILADNNTYKKD